MNDASDKSESKEQINLYGRFLCAMDATGRALLTDRDLFLEIRCRYILNANVEYSMQTATNSSLAGPFTSSPKKIVKR